MTTEYHKPCKQWTIKIEQYGMTYFITDISFKDLAESAAKGIQMDNPSARITVYFAE